MIIMYIVAGLLLLACILTVAMSDNNELHGFCILLAIAITFLATFYHTMGEAYMYHRPSELTELYMLEDLLSDFYGGADKDERFEFAYKVVSDELRAQIQYEEEKLDIHRD